MNKNQKEVEKAKLADEKKVLDALRKQYEQAAKDVQNKINFHSGRIDFMLNEWDDLDDAQRSIIQSQIYQRKFQQQLKGQLDDIVDMMDSGMFETVQDYLDQCYTTGFVGTAYDLHGQGIPIITPIDQEAMVKAVTLDPKLSEKLYGDYMGEMKQQIRGEISRGIATSDSFNNIARNITSKTNVGLNKTMRIVRTEGHRIQIEGAMEMQETAKKAGADVLKQWDATLDGKTRESHRVVDGELRELDEKFSNGLMHPADKSGGPEEVINCRCALLQRARWALDDEELETLKQRAETHGMYTKDPDGLLAKKDMDFNEFQKKFLNISKDIEISGESSTIRTTKLSNMKRRGSLPPAMDKERYERMVANLAKQGVQVFEAVGDDLAFLNMLGAEATIGGTSVIFHMGKIPSASAFFEEIIHLEQCKLYGELKSTDPHELYVREILANRKLLKYQQAYGFQKEDIEDIETNLKRWEKRFETLTGVNFDESGIGRKI